MLTFSRENLKLLRDLLRNQPYLELDHARPKFIRDTFEGTTTATWLLSQVDYQGDSLSFATHLSGIVRRDDSGDALRLLLEAIRERAPPDSRDAATIAELLAAIGAPSQIVAASAAPPAAPAVDSTSFTAELAKLSAELTALAEQNATDRADVIAVVQNALTLTDIRPIDLAESAEQLRVWATVALAELRADNAALRAQLESLTSHSAAASQYFQLNIPIVPGLLNYTVELGSGHTADLKAIWERLKARLGRGRARGMLIQPDSIPEPAPKTSPGKRYAVLVGVDTYHAKSGISPLNYCARDVRAVAERLKSAGYETFVFADGEPSAPLRRDVIVKLTRLAAAIKADDSKDNATLLFYFSGHGTSDGGESYLLTHDASWGAPLTGVKTQDVLNLLNDSHAARRILILDACKSGAPLGKSNDGMSAEFLKQVYTQAQGVAVLSSCGADEVSWEDPELGHGVFTSAVLEGLSGLAAVPDVGVVSIGSLFDYAEARVVQWALANVRKRQRPVLYAQGSSKLVVLEL